LKKLNAILVFACVLSGLLAGATIDRFVIGYPAWPYAGIVAWANYSRHADLGIGKFVYPVEAIVSLLLFIAASYIISSHKASLKQYAIPVYSAAILVAVGLFLTFFAGPYMLSIRNMPDNQALLQNAFEHFYFWSFFRGAAQVLSFFCCVWALSKSSK
jgi:hypothetical protein